MCKSKNVARRKPNIVFILVDDMGYNDIGYHNPNIISPNIDRLARSGIRLEQNYVQPQCTPSRAAFLTGMYPYHIGRQSGIIQPKGKPCQGSIRKHAKFLLLPTIEKFELILYYCYQCRSCWSYIK